MPTKPYLGEAANSVTSRWLTEIDYSSDMLISGYSAWSLLAALTLGATGPAKNELAAVTMVDGDAGPAVRELWERVSEEADGGFGLWVKPEVSIEGSFKALLPKLTTGEIPADMSILDRWISTATDGLITEFPRIVDSQTLMVLASALTVDVDWETPFETGKMKWPDSDTWFTGLGRREEVSAAASIVSLGDRSISRYVSRSTSEIDVHLVAGQAEDGPAEVLATAIGALEGTAEIIVATDLRPGDEAGCLQVKKVDGDRDYVYVQVPQFSIASSHQLTDLPSLFGLSTAMDSSRGHFGNISSFPLALQKVVQKVVAEFSATGFKAAAVTVASARAGAAPPEGVCKQVSIDHDRPFGFLVVHRPTQLVLFSGWIATSNGFDSRP